MAAEKRLSVGLTIEQKAVIESTAQAAGMTISEYVKAVFARTIPGFALVEDRRGGDRVSIEARLKPFMKEDGWYDEFAIATKVYGISATDYRSVRLADPTLDSEELGQWPLLREAKLRNNRLYNGLADANEDEANRQIAEQW